MDRGNDGKLSSRAEKRLTALEVKAFVDRGEVGKKLNDGGGLMLMINPSRSASWRIRYWFAGKEKTFSVGTFPDVTLETARAALIEVRRQVKSGIDPVMARQLEVAARVASNGSTFRDIADEWLAIRKGEWSATHYRRSASALERDIFPKLGRLPIADITPAMVSTAIAAIVGRGVRETASKILLNVSWIFRFATSKGLRNDNPALAAVEVIPRKKKRTNRLPALLDFPALGAVLRGAEAARLSPPVRQCHRLIAYTAARIGNATEAEWSEFDLDATPPSWTIPRTKMKAQDRDHDHVIFLAGTIANELRNWRTVTGGKGYLFRSPTGEGVITRDAVEKAYRVTLKLRGKHSPHGWRSALSTLAREEGGFERDVVELALDHIHDTEVVRAYDRGGRLTQRVKLWDWWGVQLDQAQRGGDVLVFKGAA